MIWEREIKFNENFIKASAEKTPLEKSMSIPILTEEEVKSALGEEQVGFSNTKTIYKSLKLSILL